MNVVANAASRFRHMSNKIQKCRVYALCAFVNLNMSFSNVSMRFTLKKDTGWIFLQIIDIVFSIAFVIIIPQDSNIYCD
jgi:hypothetical protein